MIRPARSLSRPPRSESTAWETCTTDAFARAVNATRSAPHCVTSAAKMPAPKPMVKAPMSWRSGGCSARRWRWCHRTSGGGERQHARPEREGHTGPADHAWQPLHGQLLSTSERPAAIGSRGDGRDALPSAIPGATWTSSGRRWAPGRRAGWRPWLGEGGTRATEGSQAAPRPLSRPRPDGVRCVPVWSWLITSDQPSDQDGTTARRCRTRGGVYPALAGA
jgi:hypothetical protein